MAWPSQHLQVINGPFASVGANILLAGECYFDTTNDRFYCGNGTSNILIGPGFTNPMTTVGDIIYGAASGTATRLAGNTTTTLNILCQTGDGVASAAPVWSTFATAATGYVGSSSIITVGTLTGGATGAGFTIALSTSTVSGTLPIANVPALNGFTDADVGLTDELPEYNTAATANRNVTIERLLGFANPCLCEFRLTTESGVAVSTSDRTSQGTLYLTPYQGIGGTVVGTARVSLYDGIRWKLYTNAQVSLSLTLTSGNNYDVFLYDNAGTLALETLIWTNDTTRATALDLQDGCLVKNGVTTRKYVGTIRASGSNVTADAMLSRYVWNNYNRVARPMTVTDTTDSWSYTTGTWRQANGSTANKVEYVVGLAENAVNATVLGTVGLASNSAREAMVGVGVDSITAPSGRWQGAFCGSATASFIPPGCSYSGIPTGVGYHYLAWLELGADGTCVFYGDNGGAQSNGLSATIWG